jgi:pilus assembly protein CpaB
MRAFAIRVDVTSGVSGFLRPGDRVDVYWTGDAPAVGEITRLIQPNIRLIAVDQIADTERMAPTLARTVTVEATPQQVARLAQAQSTGRLSLSLVGAEDLETADAGTIQIDQRDLLEIQRAAPQQVVEAAPVCHTRVRRGNEIAQVVIPCPSTN